jgi:DNA-directed RNA polymerase subunit omega
MIEELKSTKLVHKVGGRFKLTALIQKRLNELVQGARPLIENTEGKTLLEIVIQEILEDKIAADTQDGQSSKVDAEKERL